MPLLVLGANTCRLTTGASSILTQTPEREVSSTVGTLDNRVLFLSYWDRLYTTLGDSPNVYTRHFQHLEQSNPIDASFLLVSFPSRYHRIQNRIRFIDTRGLLFLFGPGSIIGTPIVSNFWVYDEDEEDLVCIGYFIVMEASAVKNEKENTPRFIDFKRLNRRCRVIRIPVLLIPMNSSSSFLVPVVQNHFTNVSIR